MNFKRQDRVCDLRSHVQYSSSQLISCRSHTQPCMTGPLEGQLVNRDLLVLLEQLGWLRLVYQDRGSHQAL